MTTPPRGLAEGLPGEHDLARALSRLRRLGDPLVDAALAYARLGIPVFPCCPNRKSPLVEGESELGKKDGGVYLATTDEARIRGWWKRWPFAMVGVPMGQTSGFVAFDIDPGKARPANDQIERLVEQGLEQLRVAVGGKLPAPLVAHTPRGGMHLLYAAPTGLEISNRANLFRTKGYPQIDVRGQGGYVIFAPSQRRGRRAREEGCEGLFYEWDPVEGPGEDFAASEMTPEMVALARREEPPAALSSRPSRTASRSVSGRADRRKEAAAWKAFHAELAKLEALSDGRYSYLFVAALKLGQLVATGLLSRSIVESALEAASSTNGLVTKRGPKTVRDQIKSGLERGLAEPRDLSHFDDDAPCQTASAAPSRHSEPPKAEHNPPASPLAPAHARKREASHEPAPTPRPKRKAESEERQPPQRDRLVEIGLTAELFHHDYTAFATVAVGDRHATYRIRSRAFRHWLSQMLFQAEQRAAGGEALSDAVNHLEGAAFQRESKPARLRIAEQEGCIYLDLADKEWTIAKISSAGWQLMPAAKAPVKFIRTRGMRPLPRPETGGSLKDLMDFVNVKKEDEVLVYAWLLQCFNPQGPYPVLALITRQGGGKSTTARVLRALIDPNLAPIRASPKEPRDLVVSARNSWMLAYDNISSFPEWMADGLCQIATGGGYSARELHTDEEEIVFESMRPAILNGIGNIASRPDLAERAIRISPPPIPKAKRKPERAFWKSFAEHQPFLLGAILDAVAGALSRLPNTRLKALPRMADFALFAVAAEPSLPVPRGSFMKAYDSNIEDMNQAAVDENDFAAAIVTFMRAIKDGKAPINTRKPDAKPGEWYGTAKELLDILVERVGPTTAKSKGFPTTPIVASSALTRVEVALEAIGIKVARGYRGKGKAKRRVIQLKIA